MGRWKIAVIDDEPDVFAVVEMTLDGVQICGQDVELIHAPSAADGLALFKAEEDIALAFVDVVMESDTAGLDLVRTLRRELYLWRPRLIMLTGQQVLAPERETVLSYDLDGYLDKPTVTDSRLFTAAYAGIRAYDMICRLDSARREVTMAVNQLMNAQSGPIASDVMARVVDSLSRAGTALKPAAE